MGAIASHLWQSTLVAAVAAVLVWFLRNNSASVRFWIWFAASMKFLLPFAALSTVASVVPWPQSALPGSDAVAAVNRVFGVSATPVTSPASFSAIVAVWLAGTMVLAVRWRRDWNRAAATAREAEPLNSGPVLDSLRRLEHDLGIRTPLTIVSSPHSIEPGIVGIRQPVLVWPRHLSAGLRHEHIESILAHELAHVVRRDNLLASLHMLVALAFWFHPLVWWIGRRLIEERERACDESVLEHGQSASTYAAGILKTCELCIASAVVNVAGVTGGDPKKRIRQIMRNEAYSPLGIPQKGLLAAAVAAVFLVPIFACAPASRETSNLQESDASEVFKVGGDVQSPKLRREVKPQYSARAIQEKIEGEVLMECVVGIDGKARDFKIIRSLHRDLDQAALNAGKQWEFDPGTRNGKPVPVLVTITMAFTLK